MAVPVKCEADPEHYVVVKRSLRTPANITVRRVQGKTIRAADLNFNFFTRNIYCVRTRGIGWRTLLNVYKASNFAGVLLQAQPKLVSGNSMDLFLVNLENKLKWATQSGSLNLAVCFNLRH